MLILDRFEAQYAIISMDEGTMHVDRVLIHTNAREGDVLIAKADLYCTDTEATATRREQVRSLLNGLLKK